MPFFSITVLTYNSPVDKLFLTLASILRQDFKDYEIIICDDGSEHSNFEKITSFFTSHAFTAYSLYRQPINGGIVKNFQTASKRSTGVYVKAISPGDLLFHKSTLTNLSNFLKKQNSNFAFGSWKAYRFTDSDTIEYVNAKAPWNTIPYQLQDTNAIKANILFKRDWISGATMVFRRDYILQEKFDISHSVKYCEDLVHILIALENEKIDFFNEPIVWYEWGAGISTSGSHTTELSHEQQTFLEYLSRQKSYRKIMQKVAVHENLKKVRSPLLKKVLMYINYPLSIKKEKRVTTPPTHVTGFLSDKWRLFVQSVTEQMIDQ